MERQDITALVVPVAVAAFVQPFRVKYLHRPGVTMPPHVTLHAPFKDKEDINENVLNTLAELFGSHAQFQFTLARTARFSDTGVLYLAPEPAEPFLALSRAIQAHYPDTPSDHPNPVMHLTLALSGAEALDGIEDEFQRQYGNRLPIEATATEVHLFEKRENAWIKQTSFALSDSHKQ